MSAFQTVAKLRPQVASSSNATDKIGKATEKGDRSALLRLLRGGRNERMRLVMLNWYVDIYAAGAASKGRRKLDIRAQTTD